jgi:hypothetical protein
MKSEDEKMNLCPEFLIDVKPRMTVSDLIENEKERNGEKQRGNQQNSKFLIYLSVVR